MKTQSKPSKSPYQSLLILTGIPLISVIFTGCGNLANPIDIKAPTSYSAAGGLSNFDREANLTDPNPRNYTCPSNPNILPPGAIGISYYACPNRVASNSSRLMIVQSVLSEPKICVFAMNQGSYGIGQFTRQTNYTAVDEPGFAPKTPSGPRTPMYRCVNLNTQTTTPGVGFIDFPNTPYGSTWNAVAIIKRADLDAALACMSNNLSACPEYSIGRF